MLEIVKFSLSDKSKKSHILEFSRASHFTSFSLKRNSRVFQATPMTETNELQWTSVVQARHGATAG